MATKKLFFLYLIILKSLLGIWSYNTTVTNENYQIKSTISEYDQPVITVKRKLYILEYVAKVSWIEAFRYCKLNGMELASINSEEEEKLLRKTYKTLGFGNENHYWTSGISYNKDEYFWMANGKYLAWTNWPGDYPRKTSTNQYPSCLQIIRNKAGTSWLEADCNNKEAFICEYYY